MKSVLIIGIGRFGHHLCIDMANRGNEVMIIDKDEKKTTDLLEYATAVRVGDCTNEEVLRSLGVGNFDLCFVCIGSNFQSSLEITSLVKELGAKHVVSKANRDIHAKFLLRNGADEVFLTGTSTEVMPIVKLGRQTIGNGKPGALTLRLLAEYRKLVQEGI